MGVGWGGGGVASLRGVSSHASKQVRQRQVEKAHPVKVLDVQDLHPGVHRQGSYDVLHHGAVCVGSNILLQPQDAALGLEMAGVRFDPLDEVLEGLVLHSRALSELILKQRKDQTHPF